MTWIAPGRCSFPSTGPKWRRYALRHCPSAETSATPPWLPFVLSQAMLTRWSLLAVAAKESIKLAFSIVYFYFCTSLSMVGFPPSPAPLSRALSFHPVNGLGLQTHVSSSGWLCISIPLLPVTGWRWHFVFKTCSWIWAQCRTDCVGGDSVALKF